SPDDYQVLMSWQERARYPGKGFITGYRVAPRDGGSPFDLYSDQTGRLLSEGKLKKAGIKPKRWNLPPVEQLPEIPPPVAKFAEPRPAAIGPQKNIRPGAWVLLDPIDMGKVLDDDLERQELRKGPKRIGVFQELPQGIEVKGAMTSRGEWQTLSDGSRLWSIRIYSPEAVAQRVHFTQLDLPQGAQVIVYNADYPEEAYGPYTGPCPGVTDLWTASCFSETVTVECFVPATTSIEPVRVAIDKTVHIYADFAKLEWTKGIAGDCNLDVACYDRWLGTSWGVGGIGSIGQSGSLWCTGSLIADSNPETQIPYFLTAEHCVPGQQSASSVEIYWLYQRDSCEGTVPSVYDVPRTTGGADLLATSAAPNTNPNGTDFSLLRLRNQPPAGVTYLGWSTSAQPINRSVTCIHHPSGDYKRISFGDTIYGPEYASVHRVGWNDGTTEPGSSGSPLMLTGTQQIIGQLWRGTASCSMPRELGGWDEFGRFDLTYPLVERWLGVVEPIGPEDIDKNGFVDAVDVQLVVNAALGLPITGDANVDNDPEGLVTAVDVQLVVNAVLKEQSAK
ncbi:MAG: trypsin-like peptidase domain-containing protein, partial [Candidatus Hydrogenedentota bacterium]